MPLKVKKVKRPQKGKGLGEDLITQAIKTAAKGYLSYKDYMKKNPTTPQEKAEYDAMIQKYKQQKGGSFIENAFRFVNPNFDMAMRARDSVLKKGRGKGMPVSSSFAVLNKTKLKM